MILFHFITFAISGDIFKTKPVTQCLGISVDKKTGNLVIFFSKNIAVKCTQKLSIKDDVISFLFASQGIGKK